MIKGPWPGGSTAASAPPWGLWGEELARAFGLPEARRFASLDAFEPRDGDEALVLVRLLRGPVAATVATRMAFGLPLALAGAPATDEALVDLSAALRLHEAQARLWLDPADGALRDPTDNAAIQALLPDDELQLALAGRRDSLPRRMEILSLLGHPARRRRAEDIAERSLARARAHPWPPPVRQLLDALPAHADWLRSAAAFRGLAASIAPRSAPPDDGALDKMHAVALDFLTRPQALAGTWEVQRMGVGEHPGPLLARWFPEGLLLLCLHEAGVDQTEAIADLLRSLPDQLRWYLPLSAGAAVGEPWRGIPPDADSLGLMLQLAALAPGLAPERVRAWLGFLFASLPADRRIPTWFYTAPGGGPSIEGPAWEYASNDCNTARLTCMTGLLHSGIPEAEALALDNLELAAGAFDAEGETGDFYYGRALAESAFHRFVEVLGARHPRHPHLPAALALARRLALATAPLDDGSFGDPQTTALRLEGLARFAPDPEVLRRGLRALVESQRPDGSWLASPIYKMPGRTLHEVEWHRSAELTTAICLRASARVRRALRTPPPDRCVPVR